MANEAETAIYTRLAAAPLFHPASADLFASDWTLEPGDVVTVSSGEDDYSVPVFSMNLKWTGDSKVEIASSGNQKREPLPALRRKQYSGSNAAYRQEKAYYAELHQADSDMGAKIGMVVGTTGGTNYIKTAEIVLAINADNSTDAIIHADHVYIDGDTKLSGKLSIDNQSRLVVSGGAYFSGNTWMVGSIYQLGPMYAQNNISLNPGCAVYFGSGVDPDISYTHLDGSNVGGLITDLQVTSSGNTYTLQKKTVGSSSSWTDVGNFSRAISSFSGSWSGNTYTVTAQPQNQGTSVSVQTRFGAENGNYYVEAYQSDSQSAQGISGTSITYKLARHGTTVRMDDTNDSQIPSTPTYTIPLQSKTFTSNGEKTPDSGYVGFSSVTVSVSGGSSTASDIRIGSEQFYNSSQTSYAPSATNLGNIASLILQNKNNPGYVYFKATLSTGSGEKWYRIATPV